MPLGQYPCLTGCPIVLKPLIQTKVVYTLPKAWFKDIALSGSCRVHSMSEVSQALQETEHYRNLFNPLEQFLFSHFWDWFIGTSFHLANIYWAPIMCQVPHWVQWWLQKLIKTSPCPLKTYTHSRLRYASLTISHSGIVRGGRVGIRVTKAITYFCRSVFYIFKCFWGKKTKEQ